MDRFLRFGVVRFFKQLYNDPTDALNNVYAVVLVILGVGFVIFIHELGHFLLAKWAGVKVEMFSIGFGPTLVSWRKGIGLRFGSSVKDYDQIRKADFEGTPTKDLATIGETEYSIRALPLGGFVKMLGEESGSDEQKITDPRAYHNKPVGARMAIISAGVIMNLIFGVICATWVHLRDRPVSPAVLGLVVAGQPAYAAGLRAGDEIIAIDGRKDISFEELSQAAQFSANGQKIKFEVKRPGVAEPFIREIEPKRAPNAPTPTIGVKPSLSLDFKPKGLIPDKKTKDRIPADRILAVGIDGQPDETVSDFEVLKGILAKHRDKPLKIVAERGFLDEGVGEKTPKSKVEDTLPAVNFLDFGMTMTPGPVAAVRPDSPGSKAGFLAGDVIISVEGKSDYNPMRLPDMAYAMVGKRMTFQVRRTIRDHTEDVTVVATPDDSPVWAENVENVEPLEIPGLGIAIIVTPKVAAVVPGSPAEKAKIKPGDVIATIQFAPPKPEPGDEEVELGAEPKWQKAIKLDGSQSSWPWVFDVIQGSPEPVRFELANGKAVMMTPQPVPDWFSPMRDINFYPLTRIVPPQPFGVAVVKGWRDTQNMALSIFGLIRSWIQGRLGGDSIGGPVKIGEIAFKVAKFGGLASFMRFLGLLSVNLAVINFLPIPPLDGGQMTFLIAEKIRGKPLPENAVAYPTIAGLIFVFVVFVLVFFKDVLSYF